jgi:hypothetical protein
VIDKLKRKNRPQQKPARTYSEVSSGDVHSPISSCATDTLRTSKNATAKIQHFFDICKYFSAFWCKFALNYGLTSILFILRGDKTCTVQGQEHTNCIRTAYTPHRLFIHKKGGDYRVITSLLLCDFGDIRLLSPCFNYQSISQSWMIRFIILYTKTVPNFARHLSLLIFAHSQGHITHISDKIHNCQQKKSKILAILAFFL